MFFALADDRQNDDLDRRIADAKAQIEKPVTAAQGAAESRGWAVAVEFVGVILISAFIGFAIDRWSGLGTTPWVMVGMLMFGFAAGVYRAMKTSAQFDADDTSK